MNRQCASFSFGATALIVLVAGSVIAEAARPHQPDVARGPATQPDCPEFPGADQFASPIANRLLPLVPGTTYTFKGTSDGQRETTTIEVTDQTRTILGVDAVVVNDTVRTRGELVEVTEDWFAADNEGNVWYLGEATEEYENGQVVSTEGSWQAGVDGARAGILMLADPRKGDAYGQECYPGEAEDKARVREVGTRVKVEKKTYRNALVTAEWTPLQPGVVERKWYVPCIGFVQEKRVRGRGAGLAELVSVDWPAGVTDGCDAGAASR
jgi:hypothetical protein